MSGLESTDKNPIDDTTDGGTTSINDAPLTSCDAMTERIKALQDEVASQTESASHDAMTERLQALLAPYKALQAELASYKALQAELASHKAMIDEFEAVRAELASRYTAMLEIEDTQVEMASLEATKEEYKVFEANAKEAVLKKIEAVREAMAQQCKEMHTDCTMRY
jgi:hypothetical protein